MQAEQQGPPAPSGAPREAAGPPTELGAESATARTRRLPVGLLALASAGALTTGLLGMAALSGRTSATGTRSPTPAAGPDRQAIEALLAGRARAVREHDRIAFLATLAWADADFRARQVQAFDNLSGLPITGWREVLTGARPVTGTGERSTLKLTLRYRLRGFDRADVDRTRYLTVGRRSGTGWVIVDDGLARGLPDDPEIWEAGRTVHVRGKRSLVIGAATAPTDLREIARRLDAAVPVVSATVGDRWARRVVALVPADPVQADRLTRTDPGTGLGSGTGDLRGIAALATMVPGADGSPGEDRVVISPTVFARLNPLGRQVILTHELTHVATGAARDGIRPLWLIEGLADHVGYRGTGVTVPSAARELRREIAAGRVPTDLPGQDDFTGGSDRLPQSYAEAWLACRMIADRYGERALLRLYRAAGRARSNGTGDGAKAESEEAALREVLGIGRARFVALWRTYVRAVLR